jgi:beta-phosphoglucomutase-like phosphatase (HAD superfamily)
VSPELRGQIQQRFSDPARFYDAFVTASDSSEIRLKPHRDLYSIALHTLGVPPERFHRVAGFEDSESGVIAIRAAGIPLCCALPFAMTAKHGFEAATWICPGGMPEVMVVRNFFLPVSFLS